MSYNNKFNNKSVPKSSATFGKKPFCKVCHDAGKSESEYTSHYVRSAPDHNGNSKVTCPTLNATECRYCYKLGHTTKFCPVIEENNKRAKKQQSVAIQAQKAEQRVSTKPVSSRVSNKFTSAFAALADDSDEEKQVPKVAVVVDEFPALFGSKKEVTTVAKASVSWAAMAEKPAAPVYKPAPKPEMKVFSRSATKNWADYSDSDTEEDEEDFGAPLVRTDSTYIAPCYARSSWDDNDW